MTVNRMAAALAAAWVLAVLSVGAAGPGASTAHAAAAAASPTSGMIGWRGDGTGVFPDDCKIVTEWSETKNVAWKTPLPHAGNGSPIVVGRKVFVMCEPGWKGDAPLLVCVSADDGKVLWERPVDHFDLLPPAEQKKARELRAKWFELYRKGMQSVAAAGASAGDEDDEAEPPEGRQREGGSIFSFGQIRMKEPWLRDFMKGNNWIGPTWGFLVIGTTFPTPVSDGRHVCVVTAFNAVACYDLAGNRKWIHWFRDDKLSYHEVACFVHSPLIVDGVLVVHGNRRLRAFDVAGGKVLWDIPTGMQLYMVGSPVAMTLGGTRVICTVSGEVVRLSDGKVLADKIGLFAAGAGFVGDGKGMIFGHNGRSGGAYKCPEDRLFAPDLEKKLIGVRLEPAGPDKVTPKLAWSTPYGGEDAPVYHDGVILKGGLAVEAATGKVARQARQKGARADQGWILVDGKLLGTSHTGAATVLEAESLRLLATNQLDPIPPGLAGQKREQVASFAKSLETGRWYVWNFGRSLPFASGNRLFIRSFDALYGIGEPGREFSPSRAFAEKP